MSAFDPRGHPVDLVFNSANSSNGDTDQPEFVVDPPLSNVTGMQLLWSNIPYTWYNIDRSNNKITFRILNLSAATRTVTKASGGFELDPPVQVNNNVNGSRLNYATKHTTGDSVNFKFYPKASYETKAWAESQKEDIFIQPGTYSPESLSAAVKNALAVSSLPGARGFKIIMDHSARFVIYNRALDRPYAWFGYQNDGTAIANETAEQYNQRLVNLRSTSFKFSIQVDSVSLANILGLEPGVEYMSSRYQYEDNGVVISPLYNQPAAFIKNGNNGQASDATELQGWNNYQSVPEVIALAPKLMNLNQSTSMQLYSSLSSESDKLRDVRGYSGVVSTIPITSIFTSIMQFVMPSQTVVFGQDKRSFNNVKFWLKLTGRDVYVKNSRDAYQTDALQTVNYLPLNGEAFQICVRFWVDDGVVPQPE